MKEDKEANSLENNKSAKEATGPELTDEQSSQLAQTHRLLQATDNPKLRQGGASAKTAFDINQVMALVMQFPQLLAVFQSVLAMFKKPEVAPTPAPAPTPGPTPTPTPGPTPTPAPSSDRRIESGTVHIIGLEKWNGHDNGHSAGNPNTSPYGAGYRVHMDGTPRDGHGVAFQNEDLQKQPEIFGLDSKGLIKTQWGAWSMGEGNNRIEHWLEVDGKVYGPQGDTSDGTPWDAQPYMALTSEYDDAALTPVLLVNRDAPLVGVDVRYKMVYVAPDNRKVDFGWTRVFRVHPWGF